MTRAPFQTLLEKLAQFQFGPGMQAYPAPPQATPPPPTMGGQAKAVGMGAPVHMPQVSSLSKAPGQLQGVSSKPQAPGQGVEVAKAQTSAASGPKPRGPAVPAVPPGGFQ